MKNVFMRLMLILMLIVLMCSGFTTIVMAVDVEQLITQSISNFTGIAEANILSLKKEHGNWKIVNQKIYQRFTRLRHGEMTQTTLNQLLRAGYKYTEITRAVDLAALFGGTPQDILTMKPQDMSWDDFACLVQNYAICRHLLRETNTISVSREVVLAAYLGLDIMLVEELGRKGLTLEELAGLVTLANFTGLSEQRLHSELRNVTAMSKTQFGAALHSMERIIGVK